MRRFIFALIPAFVFLLSPLTHASSPHYINGSGGIKVATPLPPGFYWTINTQLYSAKDIRNRNGKKLNLNYDTKVYIISNRLLYSSDKEIWGGRYSADITIPLIYIDFYADKTFDIPLPNHMNISEFTVTRDASKFGLSDILVTPITLSWEGKQYDFSVGMGVFLPTGNYNKRNPASSGRGFWTFKPSIGGTIYFDEAKTWSASALAHYEIHTKQRQTHQTLGNHFHFEWGISKNIAQIFEVGVSGYNSWQVTKDKGPRSSNSKTRAFAIGPEINAYIVPLGIEVQLRSQWEFKNKHNSQGNITTLSLTKPF